MAAVHALLASVIVLKGAMIHTASGPAMPSGTLIVDGSRIVATGDASLPVPPGAKVIDVTGKQIAPAFFLPLTTLGLVEIELVGATLDFREMGPTNPEARPEIAINFDSELIPVARSGGVLFGAVAPSGSVIPGAISAVRLDGYTREDACLKCPAALVIEWPDMRLDSTSELEKLEKARKKRDEAIRKLNDAFEAARTYQAARSAGPVSARNPAVEALLPVLEGRLPLLIRAPSLLQINRALRWVDEELGVTGIRVILASGPDSARVAQKLAQRKIPVILESVLEVPVRKDEPYDVYQTAAAELVKAGVLVAIGAGRFDPSSARNINHHAASAIGGGLSRLSALQAVTLNPAKLFGLEGSIGSLDPGKEASFAVWSGDPLDLRSRVEALYHRGESIDLQDRHKRLRDRYQKRPKPSAPPGSQP